MREQEKRRMLQRQMMRPSGYNPNAQVSGRSIPYSPIQGLTTLGKAFLQKQAMKNSDERTEALKAEETAGREGAYKQLTDQYFGREEQGLDQANMQEAVEANPIKAAMFAAQDPYLRGSGISSQIMPRRRGGGSLSRPIPTSEGYYQQQADNTWNKMTNANGDPLMYVGGDVDLQTNLAAGKTQGGLQGEMGNIPTQQGMRGGGVSKADVAADVQYETDIAQREAEKVITKPKIESKLESQKDSFDVLDKTVDKAIEQTEGFLSTGVGSQLTGWIGDTPASNLQATLSTIQANAGFDRLQKMRDESPTGGALGAISEIEIKLLMDSFAALQQKQSDTQLVENLKKFKEQYRKTWTNMNNAYKKDYGEYYFDPKKGFGDGIVEEGNKNIDILNPPDGWDAEDYKYLKDDEKRQAHGQE